MKENDSSDDDDNNKLSNIDDDEENIKNLEDNEGNIKKLEDIEKIVCPECGQIPILELDGKNYIIKSYCPNSHQIQEKFIDYIKNSQKQLEKSKVNIIKCSSCSKTNEDLKIKKDDMYLCACDKYFCENCKDEHEGIEEEDNEIEHNLIKYSEKDFQCKCSKSFCDYECFCLICNKNLCCNCQVEHRDKNPNHVTIYFSDEIDKYLTDEQIKEKEDHFNKMKKKINEFIKELNEWHKELETKIHKLINNLQLYMKISEYIFHSFDKCNINEQTIENIKKLNFTYDNLINEFIKTKNDNNNLNNINNQIINIDNDDEDDYTTFENRYGYLLGLFNYEKNYNINFTKKEKKKKKLFLKNLNELKSKGNIKIESTITSICKIEKGLALGDIKGQIYCYSLTKNKDTNKYNLTRTIRIPDNSGLKINYLCSLKNNHFIYSNKDELKIIKLYETNDKKQYNLIKTFKYGEDVIYQENPTFNFSKVQHLLNENENENENENKNEIIFNKTQKQKNEEKNKKKNNKNVNYQIIKLINDTIICIDGDKIMRLECIINNIYKKKPSNNLKSNIISMAEINENKFCVYSENNKITIFNSNNFEKKEKEIDIKTDDNDSLRKIEAVNNDILAAIGRNKIYLISLQGNNRNSNIIECINIERTIIDMCISGPNKIMIASFYKTDYYLMHYIVNLTKDNKISSRNDTMKYNNKINFIYPLYNEENNNNDGQLVCVHNDNEITILE